MGVLKTGFCCLSAMTAALAYYLYTPMPSEAEEPYNQRMFLAKFKLALGFTKLMDTLGLGSGIYWYRKLRSPKPYVDENDTVESEDVSFDGVEVRIYRPKDMRQDEELPGMMFFHGGGWVFGSRDSHDMLVRRICREKRMVLISVEYRMAPEFPFPTPLDDCVHATEYFIKNAAKYNTDPHRIGVMGDSAGGNLAAAVSLRLSDTKVFPKLKVQVLIYPALQAFEFASPSYIKYTGNSVPGLLNSERMSEFWLRYAYGDDYKKVNHFDLMAGKHLTDDWLKSKEATYVDIKVLPEYLQLSTDYGKGNQNRDIGVNKTISSFIKPIFLNPYFAPLMADDKKVQNMPTTYLLTAEFDPLRDDGFFLLHRLQKLNKKVKHTHYMGMDHGFMSVPTYKNGLKAAAEIAAFLEEAL